MSSISNEIKRKVKAESQMSVVIHSSVSFIWELEAERSEIQSYYWIHGGFGTSLTCVKTTSQKQHKINNPKKQKNEKHMTPSLWSVD